MENSLTQQALWGMMSLAASASTRAVIEVINLVIETEEERLSQEVTSRSGQQYTD